MREKKKLKLKKITLNPITSFILMTIIVIILSNILSAFEMQATYNIVNSNTNELESTLVATENLLSFDGMKFIISNATKNFISFAPLGMLLIALIGITIATATGFIETLSKRVLKKIPKEALTFIIIFIATCSSLINEIGYAILIPLAALIYFINDRNPILGIITAFCGVSFGYGVSIFIGTTEIALLDYTKSAARLIYENAHIPLSSNLIFIIAATIILSIVGTIIIEKIIAPKIGKYKKDEENAKTEQYKVIDIELDEQAKIEQEKKEKKGLKYATITGIIVIIIFIYTIIPNLPYSGMLLDMTEKTYLNQLFGENSYFQDGFTYMMALFFLLTGLAYGIGADSIQNDHKLIGKAAEGFEKLGSLFMLMFVAAQFIAIFKKSNIGVVITAWLANLLGALNFSGIPLIITTMIFIGLANFVLTGSASKWMIFAPVVVPMLMQSNISPAFAQIIMRAGGSLTTGYTPLLANFVIYLGYLNIYNLNKSKPYTIKKALSLITPYFLLISIAWILLVIGWYITGLPIGPGIYPTI
ncbi:MAG: AbgT family transporter [bacterium]|nr:AbgT family transporter [bacterium]